MTEREPNGSPTAPMLMTPAEAAAKSGLSESFLRTKAREGSIPHTRGGKQAIKFSQADLEDALRLLRQEPAEAKPGRLTSSRSRKRSAA